MEQHDKSHNRVISQNEFNEIYQKHIEWTKNTFGNLAPGDLSNTDLTNISFEKVENLDGFNFQNAILDMLNSIMLVCLVQIFLMPV